MGYVFVTTDPRGFSIVCSEESWHDHVLIHHPDMEGWEDDVKAAIESPEFGFIYRAAKFEDRNVYYKRIKGKRLYLKVVVRLTGDQQGRVVTAYPVAAASKGELLIWPESSL